MKRKCAIILIATLVMQLLFCDFGVYKKTVKAAALTLHNPTMINGISTWDCVYFGNYWQDDTNGDGLANKNDAKKPIKWRVLQVDGDDIFLMSDTTPSYVGDVIRTASMSGFSARHISTR